MEGVGTASIGYSLIRYPGNALFPLPYTDLGGNIIGQNPLLGPLQNNGGPTTMMPAATSPAINAGDPAFTPPPNTDQRGTGFPRVIGGRIDMGAVEAPIADLSVTKTLLPGSLVRGETVTFTISVTNNGPDSATNTVVNDALPAALTFVSATPSQGT